MAIGKLKLHWFVVSWLLVCCVSSASADATTETHRNLQRRYSTSPEDAKRSTQLAVRRRVVQEMENRRVVGKIELSVSRDESKERISRNIRQGDRRVVEKRFQHDRVRRNSVERETRSNREDLRRLSREDERRLSREVRMGENRLSQTDESRRRVNQVRINREDERRIRQGHREDRVRSNRETRKGEREIVDNENRMKQNRESQRQTRENRLDQRQTREDRRQQTRVDVREIHEERRSTPRQKKSIREIREDTRKNNEIRHSRKIDAEPEVAKDAIIQKLNFVAHQLPEATTELSLGKNELFAKEYRLEDSNDWQWDKVSASTIIGVIGFTLLVPVTGKRID